MMNNQLQENAPTVGANQTNESEDPTNPSTSPGRLVIELEPLPIAPSPPATSAEAYYFKVQGTDTKCTSNGLLDLYTHFANESKIILRIASGIVMLKGKHCITAGDIRQAIIMKASGVHHYLPSQIEE